MKTTLNAIRAHALCADGLKKLIGNLGKSAADDEPISLLTILDSNGLDDAIRCLRAVTGHDKEIRLFAVWCARQVQHLMTDPRSINALDTAEMFANETATAEELAAARDAAWAAALDAARDAARDAAGAYSWAAAGAAAWAAAGAYSWDAAGAYSWDAAGAAALDAARDAARDAAMAAAGAYSWDAAGAAAWDATGAAARAAAWAAALDAARDAARDAQKERFRELIKETGMEA